MRWGWEKWSTKNFYNIGNAMCGSSIKDNYYSFGQTPECTMQELTVFWTMDFKWTVNNCVSPFWRRIWIMGEGGYAGCRWSKRYMRTLSYYQFSFNCSKIVYENAPRKPFPYSQKGSEKDALHNRKVKFYLTNPLAPCK